MEDPNLEPTRYFPGFQPVVDLVTGGIGGYEALARYHNAQGELCSAGPVFSNPQYCREAVLAIDRHVRTQALEQFARQPESGFLTINVSPDWIDQLQGDASPTIAMVEAAGMNPQRVVIEITEGHGDMAKLQRAVRGYHRAGLRVAIDDFGAGASQIDRIIALQPDIIKLDMQLFKKAARGGLSADVMLAAATIAGRVGCDIVCEGVETEEELHFGIECGARYIQGFIFHPAQKDLLPVFETRDFARRIQQSYLQRKAAKLRSNAQHNHSICECVHHIRDLLVDERPQDVCPQELFREGVLRYYLCRPDGTQVSDNHEIGPGGIELQSWYKDNNWSHRPYFPLLIALEAAMARKLVVSSSYRDSITHKLCKTYGTYIQSDLILLVDVVVDDDVLYAMT